jgi:hypothetical protein
VCKNYAVHARTAVTFSPSGDTIDGGYGGVSPSPFSSITDLAAVTFQNGATYSTDSTAFAIDVVFAHSAAIAHRVGSINEGMVVELGDKTFKAGTHRFGSAINLAFNKNVTLDGEGDSNSKFLFQAGTTLITGANTFVNLINGA